MQETLISGDIGLEELSPQLQELILKGSENSGSVNVQTKHISATQDNQDIFNIPFEDYSIEHHLDIRINSTWISPELYQILPTNDVKFVSGVVNGTKVYFTRIAPKNQTGAKLEDLKKDLEQQIIQSQIYTTEIELELLELKQLLKEKS